MKRDFIQSHTARDEKILHHKNLIQGICLGKERTVRISERIAKASVNSEKLEAIFVKRTLWGPRSPKRSRYHREIDPFARVTQRAVLDID